MKATVTVSLDFLDLPMEREEAAKVIAQITHELAQSVNRQNSHVKVHRVPKFEALLQMSLLNKGD